MTSYLEACFSEACTAKHCSARFWEDGVLMGWVGPCDFALASLLGFGVGHSWLPSACLFEQLTAAVLVTQGICSPKGLSMIKTLGFYERKLLFRWNRLDPLGNSRSVVVPRLSSHVSHGQHSA